jgi:hypothetical protein
MLMKLTRKERKNKRMENRYNITSNALDDRTKSRQRKDKTILRCNKLK